MIRQGFSLVLILMASALLAAADGPAGSKDASPSAGQTAQPTDASTLTLDAVVRNALAQNPAIASAAHAVAAERAKIPQAGSLPDPTISAGWAGKIQPFTVQDGDPSSFRGLTVSQMLPLFGKRGLRREIAGKEADASQWDWEAVRRRVVADAKAAFYDYWYFDKAIRTTQQNRDLLSKLSQIAEARYRVGKGMQADVLRSQVEISLLLQKLTMLEQQRATAEARLNALMGRDPDAPLPAAADIAAQSPLNFTLDELYKLARTHDPEYQRMQKMVERNQSAVTLAQKDSFPDLTVSYMYQQRPAMPDMHGLTFTVNIPVFYKTKQREEVRQAKEEELSASSARDNRQNELYFNLKQNYLAAKASETLLKLYSQGVVPQSSLALESSMSSYQVGNVDFLTVVGNFTTVLNYETDYYRELANYQTALAAIEAVTGAELTGVPALSAPDKK